MKAGVADHQWTFAELVDLIDRYDPTPNFKVIPFDQLGEQSN
jgi:hypothetical protein